MVSSRDASHWDTFDVHLGPNHDIYPQSYILYLKSLCNFKVSSNGSWECHRNVDETFKTPKISQNHCNRVSKYFENLPELLAWAWPFDPEAAAAPFFGSFPDISFLSVWVLGWPWDPVGVWAPWPAPLFCSDALVLAGLVFEFEELDVFFAGGVALEGLDPINRISDL